MDKVWNSAEEAVADVKDGAVIAIGGFFSVGVPRFLLKAIVTKGVKGLTLTCGCGPLLGVPEELTQFVLNKQIKKVIDSYGLYRSASKGVQDPFEQAIRTGEIELEVYPMGTLAEKYRAGGAGIPAFYVNTGIGTVVEESVLTNIEENRLKKEIRLFDGKKYILEYALRPDFAFVHATYGDRDGNLRYNMTSRNFNPVIATAAHVTIAEVENLMEPGEMSPNDVHTPGIYVQRVIKVPHTTYDIVIN